MEDWRPRFSFRTSTTRKHFRPRESVVQRSIRDTIKKTPCSILLTLSLLMTGCLTIPEATASDLEIRAMTFNVRNGRANDGENRWALRKDFVCDVIRDDAPDILGLQEAYSFQFDDINERLAGYGEIEIGRDGGSKGEHSSILYKQNRFDVADSGTFWLSDTPAKPSAHWGNSYKRICTWARFSGYTAGAKIDYIFVTPKTHVSEASILRTHRDGRYPSDHYPVRATLHF